MKKLYSLIKASMSSDMSLFKIKTKRNSKSAVFIPILIAFYLMFMVWGSANSIFERLEPFNLSYVVLPFLIFSISVMTFIEGIYKSGSLMFNCKDDQLLLSLPLKRRTVLFVRIFKFYVFELLFNSLFLVPIMIAYIRWGANIDYTYYLTCLVMLFVLPIIPIVFSCFAGLIISSLASRFKYKNASQIIISMCFLTLIFYISFNMDNVLNYLVSHATSINDLITKIYYPAGVFAKLVTEFNFLDLIIFVFINIIIFLLSIFILSKFYFKINSRIKNVSVSSKKVNVGDLVIKSNSKVKSLVKKEINTFFKTPVFIINAGFSLVLYVIATIIILVKFDSVVPILTDSNNGLGLTEELIFNNLSIFIFGLLSLTAFTTSITNSVISLEGKGINILKSLPIKVKTILMSKVLAALVITTPVLLVCDVILFIKFKISIIESVLLITLSVLMPLVSHFIGIIVNLKYPKFDFESSAEVVKQSTSSFISVMVGMVLLIVSYMIIMNVVGDVSAILILLISTIIYLIIDIVLYLYLINNGVKKFNNLSY